MGLIPQDVIDSVLAAHDVVEVVGRYVPLKPAGRGFQALCPFHEEKTPSFHVSPDRQTWKCFGCGKGGNAIRFLTEHEGLSFPEAVRALAKERGIEVPESSSRSREEEGRVDQVRRALAFAQAFFAHSLQADIGREARAYLEGRGYDADAVKLFGLGYAPPGWDRLLAAGARKGADARLLEEAGLAVARKEEGHYDRFRHRVTFPIQDLQGRVLTFGARALGDDDHPKYLNGPETVVFHKANVLYGLNLARDGIRRSDEALLMEGYTDVLMCHLHGIDRAVAGMGTAFTPRQASLLKRFSERVVLLYDGDEAGRKAAERTFDMLLPEGLDVRVVLMPEGRDVDEILLEEGAEVVEGMIGRALDLLDFKIQLLSRRLDLSTPRGRSKAAEEVVASVVKVPSPTEQDQLLREAAERLGGVGTEEALRRVAAGLLGRGTRPMRSVVRGEHEPLPEETPLDRRRREAEAFLLAGLIVFPALRPEILRAVGPEDFGTPAHKRIYNAALRMDDAGETYDLRVLGTRMADDVEAQAILAGMPEDPALEERVPSQIAFLERQRRTRRRAREIRLELGAVESAPETAIDPTSEDRPDGAASREQIG